MTDPVSVDPDVVDVYATKQSFWQRWLPVFIAVAVVLIFLLYQVFFTAPKVERVSAPIAGSTEIVPAAQQLPAPSVELPSVEAKKPVLAEAPKAQKAEGANSSGKTKKAEPAKSASNEDADDEAWLNGEDGTDQADEAWLNGKD